MIGFIYLTTNLITNKKYIGKRQINWRQSDINMYLGSSKLLKEDIEKYGRKNFTREIICYAKTRDELSRLEKEYIIHYDAINREDFYNIHLQDEKFIVPEKQSAEHIKKRADKMKGVKRGKYNRPLNYFTKKFTPELAQDIIKLYSEGISCWQIAQRVKFHPAGVRNFLDKQNLPYKLEGWASKWTKEEEQQSISR
jgi:hypothetical protein